MRIMKFRPSILGVVFPLTFFSTLLSGFLLYYGATEQQLGVFILGLLNAIIPVVLIVALVVLRPRYYLEEERLRIRTKLNEDLNVPYRDIVLVRTYLTTQNDDYFQILYWDGECVQKKYYASPYMETAFVKAITERTKENDFTGIISGRYLSSTRGRRIMVPAKDCVLVDYCRLNKEQLFAIVQDEERLILLWDCSTDSMMRESQWKSTWGQDQDGLLSLREMKEVSSSLICVRHLRYGTIEEAVSEEKQDGSSGRIIRNIDRVAYTDYQKWQ